MNVLIAGLGSIATRHIKAIRQLYPQSNIYALRVTGDNIEDGVINIRHLSELDKKPDFAIISNPTNLHLDTINAFLPLRIPLLIEKPPLHALENADELTGRLNNYNITTYVACNMRFHPCLQFLKQYFEKNRCNINEVNVYCGSYLPDWRPSKDFRTIYSADKEKGGGVHLDLFHEMDYTCWLFGLPEKSVGFKTSKSTLRINAIDYANYILTYPSFNASIILNYYRKTPRRTIEILFDTATWVVDLIKSTITTDSNEVIFKAPDFEMSDTYKNQMTYFIECINNNIVPMNTFDESIKVLALSLQNG